MKYLWFNFQDFQVCLHGINLLILKIDTVITINYGYDLWVNPVSCDLYIKRFIEKNHFVRLSAPSSVVYRTQSIQQRISKSIIKFDFDVYFVYSNQEISTLAVTETTDSLIHGNQLKFYSIFRIDCSTQLCDLCSGTAERSDRVSTHTKGQCLHVLWFKMLINFKHV